MPISGLKILFFFAGVLILGLAVNSYLNGTIEHSKETGDTDEISVLLKDFIVPPVQINGESYLVVDGIVTKDGSTVSAETTSAVLRTAYYSVVNRVDPIFDLEGTDPEKLRAAVKNLGDSIPPLASLFSKPDEQYTISDSLYPILFLNSLPDLERKRRELVEHPTPEVARAYDADLRNTLTQYRSAISRMLPVLKTLSKQYSYVFAYPGGNSTFEGVGNSLSVLNNSAAVAQVRITARFECFQSGIGCPTISFPRERSLSSASSTTPMTDWNRRVLSTLVASERYDSSVKKQSFEAYGVVALTNAACLPTISPLYVYLWKTTDASGGSSFRFQPLNDIYFHDLQEMDRLKYYAKLREQGVPYLRQGIFNLYECIDSGRDASLLLSLFDIAQRVQERPLFQNHDVGDADISDLARIESDISTGAFVDERMVTNYINGLIRLLNTRGERELSSSIPPASVLEAERRIRLLLHNSARFEEHVQAVESMNSVVEGFNSLSGTSTPFYTLYMNRSYPSLLYLANNLSVTDPFVSFLSAQSSNEEFVSHFSTYSKLSKVYTDEEVLDILRRSSDAYATVNIGI